MFVLSVLEAPNTKTHSLCVQTYLAIKLFLILIYNNAEMYLDIFWLSNVSVSYS